jgi:hypothetical protein
MRKTLLIAAAALASGIISSQAGVYSQNIVGYANVPATGGRNTFIEVPFTIGASNGINEVFGTSLPLSSTILIWTGSGYETVLFDNSNGPGTPVWYEGNDSTPYDGVGGDPNLPTIPPGVGFFININGPTLTNTFAGAVALNVGTSNSMVLVAGRNNAVGSVVPYAGAVTNGNNSTGGPNIDLTKLPLSSTLLFWNGNGYNTALFDNSNGVGTPNWYDADDSTPYVDPTTGGNVPTIAVGQGFFINPNGPYTWVTGL